ncbi:MAG TPA: DUF4232 domain-containing protein [Solirubrobacterales bacterium]|nr:DUF4232 domain-containing protein [Solirubrobacterales bacterium]
MRTRLITAIACAAAAIACAVLGPAAANAGTGSAAPCSPATLVAWLPHGLGNGTAGSIYYNLWLTNLSGKSCTLSGFPVVSAVGLEGKKIGATAGRMPEQKSRTFKLAPDASATAQVRIVEAGAFSPSVCGPRQAAGLRVRLSGQSGSRLVALPFEACAKGTGVLSVGAFRPLE